MTNEEFIMCPVGNCEFKISVDPDDGSIVHIGAVYSHIHEMALKKDNTHTVGDIALALAEAIVL